MVKGKSLNRETKGSPSANAEFNIHEYSGAYYCEGSVGIVGVSHSLLPETLNRLETPLRLLRQGVEKCSLSKQPFAANGRSFVVELTTCSWKSSVYFNPIRGFSSFFAAVPSRWKRRRKSLGLSA